jgi:hypothetical protein
MKNNPFPLCAWMKGDPHAPAKQVMDVKDAGYVR